MAYAVYLEQLGYGPCCGFLRRLPGGSWRGFLRRWMCSGSRGWLLCRQSRFHCRFVCGWLSTWRLCYRWPSSWWHAVCHSIGIGPLRWIGAHSGICIVDIFIALYHIVIHALPNNNALGINDIKITFVIQDQVIWSVTLGKVPRTSLE